MSKKRFMMDKLGYTEKEALQELQEIANESRITASAFDFMDTSSIEGGMNPNREPEAQEEDEEAAEDES